MSQTQILIAVVAAAAIILYGRLELLSRRIAFDAVKKLELAIAHGKDPGREEELREQEEDRIEQERLEQEARRRRWRILWRTLGWTILVIGVAALILWNSPYVR
jgi:hypothetical protein